MSPKITASTVMSAIHELYRSTAHWPTADDIAGYLEVDRAVITPLLRELRDRRLYRSRQRNRRKVWMPWEAP